MTKKLNLSLIFYVHNHRNRRIFYTIFQIKKRRYNVQTTKKIHRNEIWLVNLNQNIGSEQGGNRLAIIVQNEVGNQKSPTTIICPLTSKIKTNITLTLP